MFDPSASRATCNLRRSIASSVEVNLARENSTLVVPVAPTATFRARGVPASTATVKVPSAEKVIEPESSASVPVP